ncbi:DMT family transporter [Roseomonas sp. BN140053]|uniref:DMT family transporter n=1 Tax=Roseomonas sp. BN140053 TaxID=3391898 RepID=UPI0039E83D02
MTQQDPPPRRSFPPLLLAVLGIGLLVGMDGVAKALGAQMPTLQLAFLRFLVTAVLAAILHLALGAPLPGRAALRANLPRGLLLAGSTLGFFFALVRLPLAEVLALSFLAPVLVGLLSPAMLGERPGRAAWGALGLGFAGVVVCAAGQGFGEASGQPLPQRLAGIGAVLASAFAYAVSIVLLRQRARHDGVLAVVLLQSAVPAVLLLLPAAATWQAPDTAAVLPALLGLGVLGVAGHLALAQAFARGEASRLVVSEYTGLAWAMAIGFLFFAEIPAPATLAGAALILAACLLVRH